MRNPLIQPVALLLALMASRAYGYDLFPKSPDAMGYRVYKINNDSFVARDYTNDGDIYKFTDRVMREIARMHKREIAYMVPILLDEWRTIPESKIELPHYVGTTPGTPYSGVAPKKRSVEVATLVPVESERSKPKKFYELGEGLSSDMSMGSTYRVEARTTAKTTTRTNSRTMPRMPSNSDGGYFAGPRQPSGHYAGGVGSSHRGGHYQNTYTGNHYQKRR